MFDLPNTLTINGEIYCSSEAIGAEDLWPFVVSGQKLVIEGRVYSKVDFDRLIAGNESVQYSRSMAYEIAKRLGSAELAHEMQQAQNHENLNKFND